MLERYFSQRYSREGQRAIAATSHADVELHSMHPRVDLSALHHIAALKLHVLCKLMWQIPQTEVGGTRPSPCYEVDKETIFQV